MRKGFTIVDMLYPFFDAVPKDFTRINLNPLTCLQLPIPFLLETISTDFKLTKPTLTMRGSDFFWYDQFTSISLWKNDDAISTRSLELARTRLLQGIQSNKLLFHQWFLVHFCPKTVLQPARHVPTLDFQPLT
jgi:hypothetical protein